MILICIIFISHLLKLRKTHISPCEFIIEFKKDSMNSFQIFFLFFSFSLADYCDPEKCPNLGPLLSCGESETLVDGELKPKCGYFTSGIRARYNEQRDFCQTISEDDINPMPFSSSNGTGTGNLVSIANLEENQRVYYHIRNVTGMPPDFNVFPYENCPHFWQDGSVFSFTNWNTIDLFNCGQLYATMDGKWRNTFCSGNFAVAKKAGGDLAVFVIKNSVFLHNIGILRPRNPVHFDDEALPRKAVRHFQIFVPESARVLIHGYS